MPNSRSEVRRPTSFTCESNQLPFPFHSRVDRAQSRFGPISATIRSKSSAQSTTMKEANLEDQYASFPEIRRPEVLKFLDWIHAQPHISDRFSEGEALHFFHACRYSMEVAKQVLDTNLTARTHLEEFFVNLDCERPEIRRAMRTVWVLFRPSLSLNSVNCAFTQYDFLICGQLYCSPARRHSRRIPGDSRQA